MKAKELDPLSWYISSRAGDIFTVSGQIDKAIEEYQMSISIRPDYFLTHFQLGLAYFKKKMFLKVITEFEKAYTLSDGNPLVSAALCSAYFRIWKKAKANRILEDLKVRYEVEYIPPSCFFIVY